MNNNHNNNAPLLFDKNTLDTVMVKCLLQGYNVCAPDWGETDCIYGFNKFYYFQDGEAAIIISGDPYYPKPGELFMIPSYTKHTYRQNLSNPVLKYWCHFDIKFSSEQKLIYSRDTVKCVPDRNIAIPLFERLIKLNTVSNPLDILSEKAILIELFKLFLDQVPYQKLMPQSPDHFIVRINDYIEKNLQKMITLKDMADIAHLHPNYFISYFKKSFSVSPLEYVNAVRLDKAAQLLVENPGISIEQAAYSVGFNDYRYFGRSFKKRYGLTPSAYRGLPTSYSV